MTGINDILVGNFKILCTIRQIPSRFEAVVALDFIAGRSNYSGLRIDGLLQEDNPLVIIPPHSLKTLRGH